MVEKRVFNGALFFLCVLVFAVSFYQQIDDLRGWHQFSYVFHVVVMAVCTIVSALCFWKQGGFSGIRFSQFSLLTIGVLVFAGALRLNFIHQYSIWLDEYVQIGNSLSPFIEAAIQQQPPFLYQLSTLMVEVFGYTEFWLRSSSVFFGTATIAMGALIGRLLQFRLSVQALWLLCLALNPVLLRYSFEGRPNIAGVFVVLVWIFSILSVFIDRRRQGWDFLKVGVSTYLFCSTIGMQSLALPLYSFSMLMIYSYFRRETISSSLKVMCFQVLGLILFVPVLIGIVLESIPQAQFHHVNSWAQRLSAVGSEQWILDGMKVFEMIPYAHILIVLCVCLLGGLYLKKMEAKFLGAYFCLSLAFLVLPFVYTLIFRVTINWDFFPRYFLCYVPLFYLLFAFLLNKLLRSVGDLKSMNDVRLVFPLVLVSSAIGGYFYWKYPTTFDKYNFGSDIRPVYEYIIENGKGRSQISIFSVDINFNWEMRMLLSPEFYLESSKSEKFEYRTLNEKNREEGDQVQKFIQVLSSEPFESLFLIMGPFQLFPNQQFHVPEQEDIKLIDFEGYQILHLINRKSSVFSMLKDYFLLWEKSNLNPNYDFKIKEVLFYIHFYSGEKLRAMQYWESLKAMKDDSSILKRGKLILIEKTWALSQ